MGKFTINEMLNDLNKVLNQLLATICVNRLNVGLFIQCKIKKILISYYRDGIVHMYIHKCLHIEPMLKTVYCTDAFGLSTKFKFDELVNIN